MPRQADLICTPRRRAAMMPKTTQNGGYRVTPRSPSGFSEELHHVHLDYVEGVGPVRLTVSLRGLVSRALVPTFSRNAHSARIVAISCASLASAGTRPAVVCGPHVLEHLVSYGPCLVEQCPDALVI